VTEKQMLTLKWSKIHGVSITRDTRPVDPIDQAQRIKLNDLAQALRSTHSTLLEVVKKEYESVHGTIKGPFAYFQLVTNDPLFQWLRPLSGMMASLDDLLDNKRDLKPSDAELFKLEVEKLFTSTQLIDAFATHFHARAKLEAEVKTRHLELENALQNLIDL
jgi:hypothetical protein